MPYPVAAVRGKNFGSQLTYSGKVLSYSPLAYWKMDETSGTTATDSSGNSYNGTFARDVSTMGTGTGIGDGNTAPLFDGTNDYVSIYSAGLNSAFNGDENTIMLWVKFYAVGQWVDATDSYSIQLRVDNNNRFSFGEDDSKHYWINYAAGGTNLQTQSSVAYADDYHHFAMTRSVTANQIVYYRNGSQVGTDSGLGTFTGNLDANETVIGANDDTPNDPTYGWIAHVAIFNSILDGDDISDLATV